MSNEQDPLGDPGKSLITIGILVFMIPIWIDMVSTLWFLFIVGPVLALVGVLIKSAQSGESMSRLLAVGVNQFENTEMAILPTSIGVDFLEKVVGIADNPDTTVMPIGKQPAGTHPTMGGVLETEFSSQGSSYASNSNRGEFQPDSYDEFGEHGHESVLPISDRDPVSTWYNPEDEWHNPVRYW
jgi:hypothetical protein